MPKKMKDRVFEAKSKCYEKLSDLCSNRMEKCMSRGDIEKAQRWRLFGMRCLIVRGNMVIKQMEKEAP